MKEIEVKLPVRSLPDSRRRLRGLGFTAGRRLFERNLIFDTPDQTLFLAGELLRLRSAGGRWWLTFKQRTSVERRHKVRFELEVEVHDGQRLAAILERLGFRACLEYEKYRTEFLPRAGRGKALLDETPIGNFVELEGPPGWIDRVAGDLGYNPDDYITDSYLTLYFAWCRRQGLPPTGMVFRRGTRHVP